MAALRVLEDEMGTLVFICPATGDEVLTGIEMESETLESLRTEPVRCPYCRQVHQLSGILAWLQNEDRHPPVMEQHPGGGRSA
jgi:hypothetical protein